MFSLFYLQLCSKFIQFHCDLDWCIKWFESPSWFCAEKENNLKWEQSRERMQEAQKSRFHLSQCCDSLQWDRREVKIQNCCLSQLNWLCLHSEQWGKDVSLSPVPGRTAQAQPWGFVQHRSDTHSTRGHCRATTAPGTAPGAELPCELLLHLLGRISS